MYASPWFLTMFASVLSLNVVFRIMDIFLMEVCVLSHLQHSLIQPHTLLFPTFQTCSKPRRNTILFYARSGKRICVNVFAQTAMPHITQKVPGVVYLLLELLLVKIENCS